jgi:hypothetical protein
MKKNDFGGIRFMKVIGIEFMNKFGELRSLNEWGGGTDMCLDIARWVNRCKSRIVGGERFRGLLFFAILIGRRKDE